MFIFLSYNLLLKFIFFITPPLKGVKKINLLPLGMG